MMISSHFPSRRHLLKSLGLLGIGAPLGFAAESSTGIQHIALALGECPDLKPEGGLVTGFQRFGWKAFAVGPAEGVSTTLRGLGKDAPVVPEGAICRLRLTNAIDVRNVHVIEIETPGGQPIGNFEVRFAALYQVQEMPLTTEQARVILKEGAVLKMAAGSKPLFFFAPSTSASPAPDALQLPHILIATASDTAAQFEQRLHGIVMLQGFGWQSGCVSEGLLDLAEARGHDAALLQSLDRYLDMYFTGQGVAFESPRSHPMKDKVGGIEEPLPWATLARRRPDHPALKVGRKFLASRAISKDDGSPKRDFTTEGCYTAAYPTAMLSRVLKSPELAVLALRHLEARKQVNVHEGDIYQRATTGGERRLRNWARGVCWYYLGIVRTLGALEDAGAAKTWQPEIQRVADLLLKHQRADGLWGNFIHDPKSATDTSGSAGLAAALARAHAAGWLGDEARQAAQRTLKGLDAHLTPDGLLGGAAQSNKGGDKLQKGSYRVLYQLGMGLKAQLMAALAPKAKP